MSSEKQRIKPPVSPHLPSRLEQIKLELNPGGGDQYRDILIEDGNLRGVAADQICFRSAVFRSTDLQNSLLQKLELMDVSLDHCNASNSSWRSVTMFRTEIVGCRLTGMDVSGSSFQELLISDTSLELANFRFSKFKNVCFDNCVLREADFQGADLQGVRFKKCDLRRAQLSSSKLGGTDFRGSQLDGLIVAPEQLRGAIIDTAQLMTLALNLTQAFGIVVRDEP